jgi:hypothetical protein
VAKALVLGCGYPQITNDADTACYTVGPSSFVNVLPGRYWSSATDEANHAWTADLINGVGLFSADKINQLRVWPVRGGSR